MRPSPTLSLLAALALLGACAEASAPMHAAAQAAAEEGRVHQGQTPADRLLVKSARLEIHRDDPEAGVRAASEVAERLGGWVQHSGSSSATLMVPAAQLDACVLELGHLGEVADRSIGADDITEEYRDLRIRLDNYEKERERYLELLSRAANVAEATTVEKELERVTLEVEQLKGRIQFLDQGVHFSQVDAVFSRPLRPGPLGWVFYGLFVGVKWLLVWD